MTLLQNPKLAALDIIVDPTKIVPCLAGSSGLAANHTRVMAA
jgi:hypothetical protein